MKNIFYMIGMLILMLFFMYLIGHSVHKADGYKSIILVAVFLSGFFASANELSRVLERVIK